MNQNSTHAATKVHFISVGQSDATLIESDGKFGLIDASNVYKPHYNEDIDTECDNNCANPATSVQAVIKFLEEKGVSKLDFVLATHNHTDHIGGMPAIASRFVDGNTTYYFKGLSGGNQCYKSREDYARNNRVLAHGGWSGWKNYQNCQNAVSAMANSSAKIFNFANYTGSSAKNSIKLGSANIELYNLYDKGQIIYGSANDQLHGSNYQPSSNPDTTISENNNSIITKIIDTHTKTSTLMLSDAYSIVSDTLKSKIGQVDVLKLGHHGVVDANDFDVIRDHFKPSKIVISNDTSRVNRPSSDFDKELLNKLKKSGQYEIIFTEQSVGSAQAVKADLNETVTIGKASNPAPSGWQQTDQGWKYIQDGRPLSNGCFQLRWSKNPNGDFFYFDSQGIMAVNRVTPNNCGRADENGVLHRDNINDVQSLNSETTVGAEYNNWRKIDGSWYYYDDNGNKQVGWIKDKKGDYYYLTQPHDLTNNLDYNTTTVGQQVIGMLRRTGRNGDEIFVCFDRNGYIVTGWARDEAEYDSDGQHKLRYFATRSDASSGKHGLSDPGQLLENSHGLISGSNSESGQVCPKR